MGTHCIQYARVGAGFGTECRGTEHMTDEQIIAFMKRDVATYGLVQEDDEITRINQCPECKTWTAVDGRLRTTISCPAVVAAVRQQEEYDKPPEEPAPPVAPVPEGAMPDISSPVVTASNVVELTFPIGSSPLDAVIQIASMGKKFPDHHLVMSEATNAGDIKTHWIPREMAIKLQEDMLQ